MKFKTLKNTEFKAVKLNGFVENFVILNNYKTMNALKCYIKLENGSIHVYY